MNRETTDKTIVYARSTESACIDNNKIRKALFVNPHPLYVTYTRYT